MDFLSLSLSFPTIIFSTLLVIVLCFWTITLLGFADIDILEGDVETEFAGPSLLNLGLNGVPLTVIITSVVTLGWVLNIYIQHELITNNLNNALFNSANLVGSLIVASLISSILLRPLKGIFNTASTVTKSELLGLECVIATGSVTASFGQATVFTQGTEQLIEVRSQDEDDFSLSDTAVIIDYLAEQDFFLVAKKPW